MNSQEQNHLVELDQCWKRIGVWGAGGERCPELERVIHCRNCGVYAATGRRLLDRPPPEEYFDEWTALLAGKKPLREAGHSVAFVFLAGGEWLALPAELIQEVVDMGTIHSLPHRNDQFLRGVVNIRGKLEICLSIGGVLGLKRGERPESKDGYLSPVRLVVASREGQKIVFPVSEIFGNVRYSPEMLRGLPVTVSGSKAVYTKGILCLENRDIGFLDDQLLFEALTRNLT
ncbi:chemotaxis protein CheW [Desulfurivibrio sp. D14AmB]|uniref:chemotaxis protein CheW n=1 Tax=Desulfurivibrio sp. D14AmB TaxID=3374370 RepID=UPI00376F33D6